MNNFQKGCLILTILFTINYSLYILLDFDVFYNIIHSQPLIEKIYAFLYGFCAFIDILLLQKKEKNSLSC